MGMFEDLLKLSLAVFVPPLAALWERGCGKDLAINILLTLLGALPGILHALWIVFKDEDSKEKAARRQKRHGGAYAQQPVVQQPAAAAGLQNGHGYKPQPGTVVATAQPVTYERAPAV